MEYEASEKTQLVAELNSLLAAAREVGARWWHYTASLKTFELLVGSPSENSNLVLAMSSCISISGPLEWSPQRLSLGIKQGAEPHTLIYELRDDTVSFIARSNMFSFKQGYDLLELGSVVFPNGWRASDA